MLKLSIPLFFNSNKWLGHDSTDVCLCQGWWGYGADAARCWSRSECWGEDFCWLYFCSVICLHLKLPPETVVEGKSQELKRNVSYPGQHHLKWIVKSNCIRLTLGFIAQKGSSHRTYPTGNIDLVVFVHWKWMQALALARSMDLMILEGLPESQLNKNEEGKRNTHLIICQSLSISAHWDVPAKHPQHTSAT